MVCCGTKQLAPAYIGNRKQNKTKQNKTKQNMRSQIDSQISDLLPTDRPYLPHQGPTHSGFYHCSIALPGSE